MSAHPSMCAGAKADPTKVRIADISESNVDPLARAVRHRLSRQLGIKDGIPVLLSTEKPRCRLVPIDEVGENPLDYQVCYIHMLSPSTATLVPSTISLSILLSSDYQIVRIFVVPSLQRPCSCIAPMEELSILYAMGRYTHHAPSLTCLQQELP